MTKSRRVLWAIVAVAFSISVILIAAIVIGFRSGLIHVEQRLSTGGD